VPIIIFNRAHLHLPVIPFLALCVEGRPMWISVMAQAAHLK